MQNVLLSLGREALLVVLVASAPPLVAAFLASLVAGVLQAATQIQEQTLSVVPRLAAVLAALAVSAPWIAARVVRFAASCLELVLRMPS